MFFFCVMNRRQLENFSRQAVRQRSELFSVRVIFRGVEISIPKPAADPTFALETGGYREGAAFRLRFPAEIQPPPKAKETVQEIATGQKYHIATCIPAAADSPLAQEHIVEARQA